MSMRLSLVVLLLAGVASAPLAAQTSRTSSPSPAPTAAPTGSVLPSHEVDIQFGPGGTSANKADEFRWNVTVEALTDSKAFYYWAAEVYWPSADQGGGCPSGCTAYFGLQPNGVPISGPTQPIVLFSVFGNGTTVVTAAQCAAGADGGPGESCRLPYSWSVGTTYQFDMKLTSSDSTNETWTGTVQDVSTGVVTEIASWTVPATWGLLDQTTVAFAEYYGQVESCATQAYARAQFDAPIAYQQGTGYPIQAGYPFTHGPCAGYADTMPSGTGFLVETGLAAAPAITTQPPNLTVTAGQYPQFRVAASGSPAPMYQWQVSTNGGSVWSNLVNGALYTGATTTTLTVTGATLGLNGTEYRCVATNSGGSATSSAAVLGVVTSLAPGDFDGDGKSDITVFRRSTGTWWLRTASFSASFVWGGGADTPVPGDYDGDGIADIAVFRPSTGTWYIRYSSGAPFAALVWGGVGDVVVPGDYDGDGITDIAVFRPSTGTWYIRYSSGAPFAALVWGGVGDVVVPGDYDGDGISDIAIFRPSTGTWYIRASSGVPFGAPVLGGVGDVAVPGDYDGDGKTDIAVFRASTGTWYVRASSGVVFGAPVWGGIGDIAVPGDYDGDGKTDVAVFRPSTGTWYIRYSSGAPFAALVWGGSGDIPTP
jgi:hypothetical protein